MNCDVNCTSTTSFVFDFGEIEISYLLACLLTYGAVRSPRPGTGDLCPQSHTGGLPSLSLPGEPLLPNACMDPPSMSSLLVLTSVVRPVSPLHN